MAKSRRSPTRTNWDGLGPDLKILSKIPRGKRLILLNFLHPLKLPSSNFEIKKKLRDVVGVRPGSLGIGPKEWPAYEINAIMYLDVFVVSIYIGGNGSLTPLGQLLTGISLSMPNRNNAPFLILVCGYV